MGMPAKDNTEEVSNAIFTLPNVISFIRLCMVPIFLFLLLNRYDWFATAIYTIAAVTDFLDGQIARHTHSVSKLGKILDPTVDTLLMMAGVLGVVLIGRLPIWIAVVIIAREFILLFGGAFLLYKHNIRIAVIYPGKFATTFLFVGLIGLMMNFPIIDGLGIYQAWWLPGFNSNLTSFGIWLVYAGVILQIIVTVYYFFKAFNALSQSLKKDSFS